MTGDEEKRISRMINLLVNHLRKDTPDIGSRAMAFLLASHTRDTREEWIEQMVRVWDFYHPEKNEKNV